MGRDRPEKVSGTPRGLGLYRRQGREGFFFVKNWAHLAKAFPGSLEHGGQFDEWIKRGDGSLVTSLPEAKAYCHKRNGELEQRKLALRGKFIHYSGEDLEGISQSVAEQWIKAWQKGINLQQIDLNFWQIIVCGLGDLSNAPPGYSFYATFQSGDRVLSLEAEEQKIARLIWDQGYRPCPNQFRVICSRFSILLSSHLGTAQQGKDAGAVSLPKPAFVSRAQTWKALLEAKKDEGVAHGTLRGIVVALDRLKRWLIEEYKIQLPTGLEPEVALQYRQYLYTNAGLAPVTAKKEMRYVNATFNAGLRLGLIPLNPFKNLPLNRQEALQAQMHSRKSLDRNKIIPPEVVQRIHQAMVCNKRSGRDPGFDVFYLQAVTGTRIQEVAGLRGCDFIERLSGGFIYKCIRVAHWAERGVGAAHSGRGGLKTPQSQRIIPLPLNAHGIWEKYANDKNMTAAFPGEQPKNANQNWGDNLSRRMRDKCADYPGSHGWRETLINNALNNDMPTNIVQMLTGKTGNTSLADYTSQDLSLMLKAVEHNYEAIRLPPWTDC